MSCVRPASGHAARHQKSRIDFRIVSARPTVEYCQNLALTVLCVPYSLDSGWVRMHRPPRKLARHTVEYGLSSQVN